MDLEPDLRVHLSAPAHPIARKPRAAGTPALVHVHEVRRLPILREISEVIVQRVAVLRERPDSPDLHFPVFLAHAYPLVRTYDRRGHSRPGIPRLVGSIRDNRFG